MSDDVLVAGARRTLPSWAPPAAAAIAVAVLLVWGVLVAPGSVVDGHGSRPDTPVHAQYQPYLGRPVY